MKTLEYLTTPGLAEQFWPVVVTGLAIAALCSLLSVLVVLKRMAFIGQGISHAALGGIGLAVALSSAGLFAAGGLAGSLAQFLIVLLFCLASGAAIAFMSVRAGGSRSAGAESDTAIGIVLVGTMSLGALLLQQASRATVSWESYLFGSITLVSWGDALTAWSVALATLATLWWTRRPLLFWAFDPGAARAMGVADWGMRLLLLTLLSLATVTSMKLAGVVLATAMLVLPGASALRLTTRSKPAMLLAVALAHAGVLAGLVLSFELDWLPGASIVLALCAIFALSWCWARLRPPA